MCIVNGVKDIYGIIKLNRERKVKNDAYLSFSQCHRVIEIYVFLLSAFMYHVNGYAETQKFFSINQCLKLNC